MILIFKIIEEFFREQRRGKVIPFLFVPLKVMD